MIKLEEGEVLIKKDQKDKYTDIIVASVSLDITYRYHTEFQTHTDDSPFTYFNIKTENGGGGNFFVVTSGHGVDAVDESEASFEIEKLEHLEDVIKDFKKRYKKLTVGLK